MSIKLIIYLLYWYFQQNQCLSFEKNMLCTTNIDKHEARMVVGPPGNCPVCPCVKTALMSNMPHRYHEIKRRTFVFRFYCHWAIWTRNYKPLKTMVKTKSNNSKTSRKSNELIQLASKPPPPYK